MPIRHYRSPFYMSCMNETHINGQHIRFISNIRSKAYAFHVMFFNVQPHHGSWNKTHTHTHTNRNIRCEMTPNIRTTARYIQSAMLFHCSVWWQTSKLCLRLLHILPHTHSHCHTPPNLILFNLVKIVVFVQPQMNTSNINLFCWLSSVVFDPYIHHPPPIPPLTRQIGFHSIIHFPFCF